MVRGMIEKSEDDVFQGQHLQNLRSGLGFGSPFLAAYRCISGTIREQYGNRYASTVW